MTIKKFFRYSTLAGWDQILDPDGKEKFLFYHIYNSIPNTYEILADDGTVTTINLDFLRDSRQFHTHDKWLNCELDYFHRFSGYKETSPLLDEIFEDTNFKFEDLEPQVQGGYIEWIKKLANVIVLHNLDNWSRLWYALNIKYRPLDNYDGSERSWVEGNAVTTRTPDLTNDGWQTEKEDKTERKTENKVNGFNSSSSVPQDDSSSTEDPKNTLSGRGTQPSNVHAIAENSMHTHGSDTSTFDDDSKKFSTRHGNLGVTTSQQMLQSEVEFRKQTEFYKIMFESIDEILTCKTFGGD